MFRLRTRVLISVVTACFGLGVAIAVLSAPLTAERPRPDDAQQGARKGSGASKTDDAGASEDGQGASHPEGGRHILPHDFHPRTIRVLDGQGRPLSSARLRIEDRDAVLFVDPPLQHFVMQRLQQYEVPYAALVAMDPRSGRILAYISHSSANPDAPDLARDVTPPAASVFKIVTGSALIEQGVSPATEICYGGGAHRIQPEDLRDDPARDKACASLSRAMGKSINTVFAKLASRKLGPEKLREAAMRFGFGRTIPFDAPVPPSPLEIPVDALEFARTAAGFWHVHMSPLHGALLAAVAANRGMLPRPILVAEARAHGSQGGGYRAPAVPPVRIMPEKVMAQTAKMMLETVEHGTSRSAFFDKKGRPFLPKIQVAGKTGTLSGVNPYRGFTWWVGFAPYEHPQVALAALVVNTPKWRIKASYLAREALRYFLVENPPGRRGKLQDKAKSPAP